MTFPCLDDGVQIRFDCRGQGGGVFCFEDNGRGLAGDCDIEWEMQGQAKLINIIHKQEGYLVW